MKNIPCILKINIVEGGKLRVLLALRNMNSIYIAAICGGIGAELAMIGKKEKNKDNKKK